MITHEIIGDDMQAVIVSLGSATGRGAGDRCSGGRLRSSRSVDHVDALRRNPARRSVRPIARRVPSTPRSYKNHGYREAAGLHAELQDAC